MYSLSTEFSKPGDCSQHKGKYYWRSLLEVDMNKKWIVVSIMVIGILLLAGMNAAEASGQISQEQYYNGYDPYTPEWNSPYPNWDNDWWQGNRSGNNCNYGYCCPVQWFNPCNRAEFVQDVTYADGTYIAPGYYFTKTWRIRNTGSCAWNSSYRLVFVSGDSMSAPQSIPIPRYVAPGQTVDISVNLIAPNSVGTFRGNWMIMSPDGTTFGVGPCGDIPIWVNISTWQNNCYCVGTYNCNCVKPCYGVQCSPMPQSHQTGRNPFCNNKIKSKSVSDVTIPDGEIFAPNTYFRKTWRMTNGGTCVWDESYTLIFTGGDSMSGPEYIHLPKKVYPGETVEISIDLRAPAKPGLYRAYYMLQDNLGYSFGFGAYANTAFWVEIQVREEAAETADTADTKDSSEPVVDNLSVNSTETVELEKPEGTDSDINPTNIPEADTAEPEPTALNACGTQHIEVDHSLEDTYNITWYVTNAGFSTWSPDKYTLVSSGISDNLYLDSESIVIPETQPGQEAKVEFTAKLWNKDDTTTKPWMKFYMSDGSESFCDVYFDLQN